jgi:hypothetical protein
MAAIASITATSKIPLDIRILTAPPFIKNYTLFGLLFLSLYNGTILQRFSSPDILPKCAEYVIPLYIIIQSG